MVKKLYVGNIPWGTTEEALQELFENYGEVKSAKIITDRMTGKSKGFGFVELENADEALNALNDKDFNGRKLRVDWAAEKKSRF